MDNKRFDSLTRAFASGQSRRSVLKGLFGFGGAAVVTTVVADETDARRSRSSRPSRPVCESPLLQCGTSTFCCEPGQCAHNDVGCCPVGTSACDTNSTGCCSDCANGGVTCGYDCCDTEDACCDNECCPIGEVCVARKLDCSNYFCEERCCDDDQICDGRCCHGACFWDFDSIVFDDDDAPEENRYDRACCPPFATYCPYLGNTDYGFCCDSDTPKCCQSRNGHPSCLRENQCCGVQDCIDQHGGEEACWSCEANECIAVPPDDQGDCDDCFGCSGIQECVPNPTVNGETCGDGGDCCDGVCCYDYCLDGNCVTSTTTSAPTSTTQVPSTTTTTTTTTTTDTTAPPPICSPSCAGGETCCPSAITDPYCVDLLNSNFNCGTCGHVCGLCTSCSGGGCFPVNDQTQCFDGGNGVCCGGMCRVGASTCETTTSTTTTETTAPPDLCSGPSACAPCTNCNPANGQCVPIQCEFCEVCNEITNACETRDTLCCRNGCPPSCSCDPGSGNCLCPG